MADILAIGNSVNAHSSPDAWSYILSYFKSRCHLGKREEAAAVGEP